MEKKILVIIDQMTTGGAARVTSTLLRGLVTFGYKVSIAFDNVNCKQFYDIPNDIHIIPLELKRDGRTKGFKQISLLLETCRIIRKERPLLIIAVTFFPFFYSYFAKIGTGIPVIAYDHTSFGRDMGWFVNFIRFKLYGYADTLVIQTHKDAKLLGTRFPRKKVIYNPLTYPINYDGKNHRGKKILCAGRLDSWYIKGIDIIFDIWSRISRTHTDWQLMIAGSGTPGTLSVINNMIKKNGIEKSVVLLGQIDDMALLYSRTSIFALPSRVEGFPMVLMEAMSQGCACVTFDMEGAVREMMSNSSGIIVPDGDINTFEKSLNILIERYPDYGNIRESSFRDVEKFSDKEFNAQWAETIKQVLTP